MYYGTQVVISSYFLSKLCHFYETRSGYTRSKVWVRFWGPLVTRKMTDIPKRRKSYSILIVDKSDRRK